MMWRSAGTLNILDIFLVSSFIFPKLVPLILLDEMTKLLRLLELYELICLFLFRGDGHLALLVLGGGWLSVVLEMGGGGVGVLVLTSCMF